MTDLDVTAVLRKTEAGMNAIKLRDRALTPKLRMLLITVNGVKTVAESLCLQNERCTSATQFNTKISEIARIVGAMRSEKKAAEFLLVKIP